MLRTFLQKGNQRQLKSVKRLVCTNIQQNIMHAPLSTFEKVMYYLPFCPRPIYVLDVNASELCVPRFEDRCEIKELKKEIMQNIELKRYRIGTCIIKPSPHYIYGYSVRIGAYVGLSVSLIFNFGPIFLLPIVFLLIVLPESDDIVKQDFSVYRLRHLIKSEEVCNQEKPMCTYEHCVYHTEKEKVIPSSKKADE